MGLLEDLIVLYKEAQDEVSQRGKPASNAPAASGQPSINELRERMRQQARKASAQARGAKAAPAPAPEVDREAEHHAARLAERHAATRQAHEAAAKAKLATAGHHARFARLLRQPHTLRDLIVLKELLDRPLALRRFPHQR